MATRLPIVGGDSGNWGAILNEFLGIGHSASGINQGPVVETVINGSYAVQPNDNGTRLVVTAAVTLSVPSVGTLGNGFECEIINDSNGTVIIDGPGATNVTLSGGDIACLLEFNSKQRVVSGAGTLIS